MHRAVHTTAAMLRRRADQFILGAVLVIAFGIGIWRVEQIAHDAVDNADRTELLAAQLSDLIAQRDLDLAEARHATCVRDNVQTIRDRKALIAAFRSLIDGPLNPSQQAAYDRVVASAEQHYPFRDCSPAGIERHLSNPPSDPATIPTSSTSAP